jgi:MOSC domain-containing protein YiiM
LASGGYIPAVTHRRPIGDANLLSPDCPLARLFAAPMRPGEVTWIGLRPARRQPLVPVARADLDPDRGLIGDHGHGRTRQVTLMQVEHLAAIAAYLGCAPIDPGLLRRNILVRGSNLHALKDRAFRLGTALLVTTGACHPCSRMEELLGHGGYITARVITAGEVRLGDPLDAVTKSALP